MVREHLEQASDTAIRELYPELPSDELIEAEENLNRYLELALRIWRRIESENQNDSMRLTVPKDDPTIRPKVEPIRNHEHNT